MTSAIDKLREEIVVRERFKAIRHIGYHSIHYEGGYYWSWLPKPTNQSKMILHRWNPETDTWEHHSHARFLPSRAWGSWPKETDPFPPQGE